MARQAVGTTDLQRLVGRMRREGERLVGRLQRDVQTLSKRTRSELAADVRQVRKDLEGRAKAALKDIEGRGGRALGSVEARLTGLGEQLLVRLQAATRKDLAALERRIELLEHRNVELEERLADLLPGVSRD